MEAVGQTNAVQPGKWLILLLVAAIDLVLMYGVTLMYAQGETAFALLVLILMASGTWVFINKKGYNYRYVFPSILGVVTFIVFPLLYTVNVAFTNYGSSNLLPLERVKAIHLAKTYSTGGDNYTFKLYSLADKQGSEKTPKYQLLLTPQGKNTTFLSAPFSRQKDGSPLSDNGPVWPTQFR